MGSQIVKRINALLAEKGISKKQFYKDCEITSASYSLWNQNKTMPKMKNLERIADYLGVSVSMLLGDDIYGLSKQETAENKQPPSEDGELEEYREYLRTRPEMRMLFHTFKGATKEEIEAIVVAWEARNGRKE